MLDLWVVSNDFVKEGDWVENGGIGGILDLIHVSEKYCIFNGDLVPEVSEVSETVVWVLTSVAMP